jgi:cytoskeletal protein RodZ
MIERPARRVSSMASRTGATPLARTARTVAEPPPEAYAPPEPVTGAEYSQMRVYRRERATPGRRWKLAIATGLLACLIAVAAMTLPELVAGRSVVSSSHHTTIFGGHRNTQRTPSKSTTTDKEKSTSTEQKSTTTAPETTTTAPEQTQSQTQTQPPAQTQTQPAAPQSQTQTQPPPAQTQPAPQQTTPAPTP